MEKVVLEKVTLEIKVASDGDIYVMCKKYNQYGTIVNSSHGIYYYPSPHLGPFKEYIQAIIEAIKPFGVALTLPVSPSAKET